MSRVKGRKLGKKFKTIGPERNERKVTLMVRQDHGKEKVENSNLEGKHSPSPTIRTQVVCIPSVIVF